MKGVLGRIGFYPFKDGKDEGIKKTEVNYEIKFSWNSVEKKYKLRVDFRKGFPAFEKEKVVRSYILNQLRENIINWEIKEFGELSLDFKDFSPEFVHNLDKTLNLLHQQEQEYTKLVYIDNYPIKLYLKKDGKVRLEVIYGKDQQKPFEVMAKILNEKFRLHEVEYRNEIYFQELHKSFEDSTKFIQSSTKTIEEVKEDQINLFYELNTIITSEREISDSFSNQTHILLKLSENQDKIIETQNLLTQNLIQIQNLITENFEQIFHKNQEIYSKLTVESYNLRNEIQELKTSKLSFKIRKFFSKLFRRNRT